MCGIWGGRGFSVLSQEKAFADLLSHRGPDFQAVEQIGEVPDRSVWLGHTRLSVIDTRAVANQPMWSRDRGHCIAFNGEIYNYRELRQRYCSEYPFLSDGDTEVLLVLWQRLGPECLKLLKGMFAFAIHDVFKGETYLCRDHLGIKPLYYVRGEDGNFAFASEVSVLQVVGLGGDVRPEALAEYFYRRYVPGAETIFGGVMRLPPASFVKCTETAILDPLTYWRPPPVENGGPGRDLVDELDVLLSAAVTSQLIADVPLGVFLSGGIDSSLIAAIAVRKLGKPVDTFSISFDDPEFDESEAALAVADYLGARHHKIQFKGTLKDWLPAVAAKIDEPLADPAALPFYLLCHFARERVVVALSGDGADELFAGYKQYRFEPFVPWLRPLAPAIKRAFNFLGWSERRDRLMRVLGTRGRDHWAEWTGALSFDLSERLTKRPILKERSRSLTLAERLNEDLQGPLVDRMLMKVDKMSMAHSLEVRVPFLDQQVVDFACRLDPKFKVSPSGDKLVLRRLARRYLPPPVVQRRKHGFNLPVSSWLRGPDTDFCREILLVPNTPLRRWLDMDLVKKLAAAHFSGEADHGLALYAMLLLSLWLTSHDGLKESMD